MFWRLFLGSLLLAVSLSADQIYAWVTPPQEFGTEADGTPLYGGIIEIGEPYIEQTIQYAGTAYDVDVANYNSPLPGLEEFYVLTVAPDPVPEPALWSLVAGCLLGLTLSRKRKPRWLERNFGRARKT